MYIENNLLNNLENNICLINATDKMTIDHSIMHTKYEMLAYVYTKYMFWYY